MIILLDEYTRKCLCTQVVRQLTSTNVVSVLGEAIEEEGAPSYIRSDNSGESIAHQVHQRWSDKTSRQYTSIRATWLPSEATPYELANI